MNTALTIVAIAWVAVTTARMYRTFRNTNLRIECDLAELRNTYEPIDYWPVDYFDDWADVIDRDTWDDVLREGRAVWPMTAGGFE